MKSCRVHWDSSHSEEEEEDELWVKKSAGSLHTALWKEASLIRRCLNVLFCYTASTENSIHRPAGGIVENNEHQQK